MSRMPRVNQAALYHQDEIAALKHERDAAFNEGLEAAALYHDGEAERIRKICRPLTLAPIAAIYAHDEAASAIRALKRGAPSKG
jgi:hypothetical protein